MVYQIDCFNINMFFFKWFGIWASEDNQFRYYAIYSKIFVSIFVVLYDFLFTINFYFIEKQLDKVVEEMVLWLTMISVTSKAFTFLILHDGINKILSQLESDIFQPKSAVGKKIILKTKNQNVLFWRIFAVFSVTSNFCHAVLPFLLHLTLGHDLYLPVCSYAFFSKEMIQKLIYPLYLYQMIGIHINMWYNVNIDSFFLGLMNFTIAQLEVLDDKLRKLTEDDKFDDGTEGDIEDVFYLRLKQCIKHYTRVADFCSLIEDTFSVTLFTQFSIASYVICVCLFRLTLPLTPSYLLFLTTYILIMVLQILIPCWFGHRITEKSDHLTSAIYNCDWTSRPSRFKTSLRVFVERFYRPLSITGWKIFPLLLTTFTSGHHQITLNDYNESLQAPLTIIANSAYSFYTLLRNVQKGD